MTTRTSSTTTAPAISQADPIHSQRSPPSTRRGRELLTGERGRAVCTSCRAIGTFETPVGPITVSSDGRSVVGLEWRSSPADAAGGEPDRDHSAGARDLDRGQATDGRMESILVQATAPLRPSDRAIGSFESPVGPITVSSDGRSVVGLEWRSSPADAAGGEPDRDHSAGARDLDRGQATDGRMDPILVEAIAQLRAYFDGRL